MILEVKIASVKGCLEMLGWGVKMGNKSELGKIKSCGKMWYMRAKMDTW